MPHPKRRHSKARKGKRRSHLGLGLTQPHYDPRNGAVTRSHRVNEDESTHYGFAKGGTKGSAVFERGDEDEAL